MVEADPRPSDVRLAQATGPAATKRDSSPARAFRGGTGRGRSTWQVAYLSRPTGTTALPPRLSPSVPGPAIGGRVCCSTPHTGVAFQGGRGRGTDDAKVAVDDAPPCASGSALATHLTATAGSASRDSSHCSRVTETALVAVKRTPPEHQHEACAQAVSPQRAPLPCHLGRGGGAF